MDDFRTLVSYDPSCGVTYDHHSDDSRGLIYDRNIFIIHDTDLVSNVTMVLVTKFVARYS